MTTIHTPDPVKPGYGPAKLLKMFDVPVDLWDANTDFFVVGNVRCRLIAVDRVGGRRAGEVIHRLVPVAFTGTLSKYSRGADNEERVDSLVCSTPVLLDTRDTADLEPCDDPQIPDSVNDALIEFVRDAVKLTQDMARSRAVLAAAEAVKAGTPNGVWL